MRRTHALLLPLLLASVLPGPLEGQEGTFSVELRGGALYSTPFVEARVPLPTTEDLSVVDVELGRGISPYLGLGLLRDFGERIWGELQAGATFGSLEVDGHSGSWDAGDLITFHGTAGVRVGLDRGLHARGGVGMVAFAASDDLALFQEGEDTGLFLSAGVGYQPLLERPFFLEAEFHRFDFGTPTLRRAGAVDGAVQRWVLTLGYQIGGGGGG